MNQSNHFTGDERDTESNTEHTWFRQLSTTQGRWTSPDPLAGDISNPQSLNRYAYVMNDPINYLDPFGLDSTATKFENGCIFTSFSNSTVTTDANGNVSTTVTWSPWSNFCSGGRSPFCSMGWTGITCLNTLGNAIVGGAGPTANKVKQKTPQQQLQQCLTKFYDSKTGKGVQFGSPLALLPGWNPQWKQNLGEWGVAIFGKAGGLFGSGAVPGTTELTTLSGTTTVGSALELGTEVVLGAVEKAALPAMAAATAADIAAHNACFFQSLPQNIVEQIGGAVGP